MSDPLILGIESTCDETGVALVRGRELLADVTATSMDQYARFGGIIPEIASRAHLESFLPTLDVALERADVDLSQVDAVAVCAGPGLIGSLTVGISAAKDKERHRYDFSFSGLKTAVARYIESLEDAGRQVPGADVCAAFSEAVNDSLTAKAVQACLDVGCDMLIIGGGYCANSRLRALAAERCKVAGIALRLPPLRFCTDNGAQIAALGSAAVRAGVAPSPMDFAPDSGMSLDLSVVH